MAENKVLVADDEIHIVHVVAVKLRSNGYQVVAAENGAEAYDLALRERPDIVVADYHMPIMTGLELVRKLRENETTRNIPVVMLTARGFAIDQCEKDKLGIAEFLSKPFSPRELLRHIEDILYEQVASARRD